MRRVLMPPPMQRLTDIPSWIIQLRALADRAPAHDPLALDDLESPLRAALQLPALDAAMPVSQTSSPEATLWAARVNAGIDVDDILFRADDGPLLPTSRATAIEVWTDAELAALHATWWLATQADHERRSARLDRALAWHLDHTQPDNATNRPWAIHVFLTAGTPDAMHYAATLIHNAIALDGRPTTLGGALLRDAADALDARSAP